MPSLDPEDRLRLLGPLEHPCGECGGVVIRHYCRSCDEFIIQCGCLGRLHPLGEAHVRHRVYLWTVTGIIALPVFDHLGGK